MLGRAYIEAGVVERDPHHPLVRVPVWIVGTQRIVVGIGVGMRAKIFAMSSPHDVRLCFGRSAGLPLLPIPGVEAIQVRGLEQAVSFGSGSAGRQSDLGVAALENEIGMILVGGLDLREKFHPGGWTALRVDEEPCSA